MINSGLVSISFRQLTVEQIIELVKKSGLDGIEWGGDKHVPHGDVQRAKQVRQLTEEAGLKVAAYGSYYKIGVSEGEGLSFSMVLDSAVALGAPKIRVWAGKKNSEDASPQDWDLIVKESRWIGDMAAAKGIKIVYEFHGGTLTNTAASCKKLLETVAHSNVMTYWQPTLGVKCADNAAGLKSVLPWVQGTHVFHWWPDHLTRFALSEGEADWSCYFEVLKSSKRDMFAMMEFVKDDNPENFAPDAATLKKLLAKVNS